MLIADVPNCHITL